MWRKKLQIILIIVTSSGHTVMFHEIYLLSNSLYLKIKINFAGQMNENLTVSALVVDPD